LLQDRTNIMFKTCPQNKKNALRVTCRGFTLVELLVVVAVIGILGAIAIPMYNGYVRDAKVKAARSTLEQFPVLIEQYRAEFGRMCPGCNATGNYTFSYSENDDGTVPAGGDTITPTYPDFKPKGSTSSSSPYNYDLRIAVTNCGNATGCVERARFRALSVAGARGGPGGNITGNPNPYL